MAEASSQLASVIFACSPKMVVLVRYTRISIISPAGSSSAPRAAVRMVLAGTADCRINSIMRDIGESYWSDTGQILSKLFRF